MVPFVKTNALGNDFLLVEDTTVPKADYADLTTRICDRRFGIGADGLIVWNATDDDVRVRIFNVDGSEAECSGNGLRCVAAYLMRPGHSSSEELRIWTVSGKYPIRRVDQGFETIMGRPGVSPAEIPFLGSEGLERIVDHPLEVDGREVRVTACSIGNPHCSLFVDSLKNDIVEELGPKLETHNAFPNRTNVEFIRVRSRNEIDVAFWERGVGLTLASGTGSCGATVASILTNRTERQVRVHTRAGTLDVEWDLEGNLKLTGTATVVAEGRYLNL